LRIGELQTTVTNPGQRGLKLHHWREWIREFFLTDSQVKNEDILLADCLRQHFDQESKDELWEAKSIKIRYFPKGGAAELSQCDNSLIRDFRVDLAGISEQSNHQILGQMRLRC